MDIAGTGFVTTFAYDMANHKVTTTQGAQTRIVQTDAAGRTIYVQEPERGVTTYSYAYNPTGLAVTRLRPRANQTNASVTTQTITQYDKLGRVISVSYNDGTPNKTFTYDQAPSGGSLPSSGSSLGQLTVMSNGVASRAYAYDIMGRVSQTVDCLPDWCGQSQHDVYRSYSYDDTGNLTGDQYGTTGGGLQNPATVLNGFNQAAQLVSVSGGQNGVSGFPYIYSTTSSTLLPFGPQTATFGNGLVATSQYDGVGRLQSRWLCGNPGGVGCPNEGDYNTNFTLQVGSQVKWVLDDAEGRYTDFQYDDMGRLVGGSPHSGFAGLSLSASYDRYGNRWTQTVGNTNSSANFNTSYSFNAATNQNTMMSYDAAGNMTSDGTTSGYQYDAEGNLTAISGASAAYAYNALNQRQKATVNGVTERYGLDLAGRRSTTWQDGTGALELAQYYGDRGPLAFWSSSDSRIHFEHQDTLGSERVRTVYNGAELFIGSLPFGELDTTNGTDIAPPHFALMDADVSPSSGLAHAMFREYSSTQGRWTSPDPYDGSYDTSNPQSLNRYNYVLNNPLSLIDPLGQDLLCNTYTFSTSLRNGSPQAHDSGTITECFEVDEGGGGGGYAGGGGGGLLPSVPLKPYSPPPVNIPTPCSVPLAPSGVSVNTNIHFANTLHIFNVLNIPIFYQLVRNKGPMDYKQGTHTLSDMGQLGPSPYADFGNFNYGAVGAAFGLPLNLLLRAAGYAQEQAGTSTPEWGNWKGAPPYGDDPDDQTQIMAGYNYYKAGCYKKE